MRGARGVHVYVALALAVVLAGCGSSTPTKHDFVARANAICAGTLRQTRAIGAPTSAGAGLAAYLAKAVPLVQSEADQLRALKRPTDTARDRQTLTQYFSALDQVVAAYRRLETAARRGDAAGVATVEASLRANPVTTLAARYGMRSCGTPGATAA
jgi:uncharacterized lipoprotein YmbA